MYGRLSSTAAVAVGTLFVGVAGAGDTVRLVDRPSDRTETRTLELRPSDQAATDTELTHWRRGWGGGWGGGWGRGWGWGGGLAWGGGWGGWGRGWGWGGGLGWGVGHWGGYRSWGGIGFGGWPYGSYSLYSPAFYSSPVYSYYSLPSVSYYASPVYYSVPFVDYCSPTISVIRDRVEVPAANGSFRYDGGPARPIPPARESDLLPAPNGPVDPKAPKLGPSPIDRPVSFPAQHKRFEYPAYGEGPDARPAPRPVKELLVRGSSK